MLPGLQRSTGWGYAGVNTHTAGSVGQGRRQNTDKPRIEKWHKEFDCDSGHRARGGGGGGWVWWLGSTVFGLQLTTPIIKLPQMQGLIPYQQTNNLSKYSPWTPCWHGAVFYLSWHLEKKKRKLVNTKKENKKTPTMSDWKESYSLFFH